jgi:hypothetical protein
MSSVSDVYEVNDAILTDPCASPIEAPSECEAPIFNLQADCFSNARAERLNLATGALTALILEAAVGFSLFCIWQLRHIVR